MQSFISETLEDILKKTNDFRDVVFVMPSQRSTIFLKKHLIEKASNGFLPELFSIEQFIEEISGLFKIETIPLLFEFYTVYLEVEENPDAFDVFSSWAYTVLQDFNEIDQYLIDAKDIFIAVRDIRRLQKWSVNGTFKETGLIKDYYKFLEKLYKFYPLLYKRLKEKNLGYQGLLYREACKHIGEYIKKNDFKNFFFLGFNALNKAEEEIFNQFLNRGIADIYWDLDEAFYQNNHQAGKFIRKYESTWKYYEKHQLKKIGNYFSSNKNISVVGTPKNITQIKYVGEILSTYKDFENTAIVLADETLLTPMLRSLPENVNALNITMGFPLKDVPTTNCILSIFKLFIVQNKLNRTTSNEFYYKEVIQFLKEPLLYYCFTEKDQEVVNLFLITIAKENLLFLPYKKLQDTFQKCSNEVNELLTAIFNIKDIGNFIDQILSFLSLLKDRVSVIEKEYLYRYHIIFTQLKNVQATYSYFTDFKNLEQFFKQLVSSETLSFKGEPLKGLQLMGMLETRVLDFKNIILVGANEGILPNNTMQNSFIPFDVKVSFGLPTYREKDTIFSYHFFRLLQRAEHISVLYNTEPDAFGSGEKSRFVKQLELIKDVNLEYISPKIISQKIPLQSIAKEECVLETLKALANKGISPSALTTYLYNPLSFYKQKVLKIKEVDAVEETVAFNTLGTVVHDVLDDLYKPFIGRFLEKNHVDNMSANSRGIVEKYFKVHFKNGDISTGKNRLIFEVANQFVQNFLIKERELLQNKENRLKIIATEETLSTEIKINGLNFSVKLRGQVDRVDELNGVLRIIDYKTGKVDTNNLRVTDMELLREEKHHKAIQVLLYAYLFFSNNPDKIDKELTAGIFSFKNLNKGFLAVNFSSNYRNSDLRITQERLEEFIEEVKKYILEMYNPAIEFVEPANLKY